MADRAKPPDLLLAYNDEFTGYGSVDRMAQPLEPTEFLATAPGPWGATGTLGGTPDPDGYYEDFTAHLDRFVRMYPRIGGGRARGRARPLDWNALVITLKASPAPEDADGDDADGGDADGDDAAEGGTPARLVSLSDYIVDAAEGGKRAGTAASVGAGKPVGGGLNGDGHEYDGYDGDYGSGGGDYGYDGDDGYGYDGDDGDGGYGGGDSGYGGYGGDGGDGYRSCDGGGQDDGDDPSGPSGAGGPAYGGDASDLEGEMDETSVESVPFEVFRALPLDLNRPEPPSILEFVTEK